MFHSRFVVAVFCGLMSVLLSVSAGVAEADIDVVVPTLPDYRFGMRAAISGDASLLATYDDHGAQLWHIRTWKFLRPLTDEGVSARISVALSGDGRRAVSFTTDGAIGLWDTDTGRLTTSHPAAAAQFMMTRLTMSPSGDHYARSEYDGTVVYSSASGNAVARVSHGQGGWTAVRWTEAALYLWNSRRLILLEGADYSSTATFEAAEVDPAGKFAGITGGQPSFVRVTGDTLEVGTFDRAKREVTWGETLQLQPGFGEQLKNEDITRLSSEAFVAKGQILLVADGKLDGYIHLNSSGNDMSIAANERAVAWGLQSGTAAGGLPAIFDTASKRAYQFTGPPALQDLEFAALGLSVASSPRFDGQGTRLLLSDAVVGDVLADCSTTGKSSAITSIGAALYIGVAEGALADCSRSATAVESLQVAIAAPDDQLAAVPGLGFVVVPGWDHDLLYFADEGLGALNGRRDISTSMQFSRRPGDAAVFAPGHAPVRLQTNSPFDITIEHLTASADGRALAVGDQGNRVAVYDTGSGALLQEFGNCSVANVQRGLIEIGLLGDSADGDFGKRSRQAVIEMSSRHLYTFDQQSKVAFDPSAFDLTDAQLVNLACGAMGLNAVASGTIRDIDLSADGRFVATLSSGFYQGDFEQVRLWDVATGAIVSEFNRRASPSARQIRILDERRMLVGRGAQLEVTDASSGDVLQSYSARDRIVDIRSAGDKVMLVLVDRTVETFDAQGERLSTYLQSVDGEWVAMTKDGFFAGSEKGASLLQLTIGRSVMTLGNLEPLLYRPDLVEALAEGDPNGLYAAAAVETNLASALASGNAPTVRILKVEQVGDKVDERRLTVVLTAQSGGVGRIVVARDGAAIGVFEAPAGLEVGASVEVPLTIPVVDGNNRVSVTAFNTDGVIESDAAVSAFEAVIPEAAPVLHIVAIGINDYEETRLKLKYAAPDARALTEVLRSAGSELFSDVRVRMLIDRDATAPSIDALFAEVAQSVGTNDVFVFYLSGHGTTKDGNYYFIPADFAYDGEEALQKRGIGQEQIQRWLASIPAQKSILMLDTCESGSLVDLNFATRGIAEAVAIDRLNRAIGRSVIAASTDKEPALEGYRGHGVFTYAVLEAVADGDGNGDGVIDLSELFQHVDLRVPEISVAAFDFRQTPQTQIRGTNFPLARPTVSPELNSDEEFVPKHATHVVIADAMLFADEELRTPSGEALRPGTQLAVVRVLGSVVEIARDGQKIGYVDGASLVKLQ